MRERIKMMALAFMLLSFPLTAYADKITISCPSSVKVGEVVNCEIKGKSDTKITSLETKITYGEKVSFVSFANSGNWQGDASNGILSLYGSGYSGDFPIGILKVKSSGVGNNGISLSSVIFYDENDKARNVDSISVNLNINSQQPSTGGEIQNKTASTASTTNTTTTNNNNNNGSSGNQKSETTEKDSDNYIKSLSIEGYLLDFDPEVTEYDLSIGEDDSLFFDLTLSSDKANYTIEGNTELVDGSSILINVIAEDDSSRTYTINIHKNEKSKISSSQNKYVRYVFIGIIAFLVLVNIIRLIKSLKRK